MAEVTYTTGLVIILPTSAWPPIQALRAAHDRKLRRWMPHVTLIYPFLPAEEFDRAASRLAPACAAQRPFGLTLASFDSFRHHRDNYTVWLRPEPGAPLVALHEALWEATWAGPAPGTPWRRFRRGMTTRPSQPSERCSKPRHPGWGPAWTAWPWPSPWADVVLSGATTAEQLGSNLAALAGSWDDRAGEPLGALAEGPEDYWSTRSLLPWN